MANEETRPFRMCDSCGQVDDHPRHVFATGAGEAATSDEVAQKALEAAGPEHYLEILRQVRDDAVIQKHMDCCAQDGCPDGSCVTMVAESKGKKGADLVKFLTSRQPQED